MELVTHLKRAKPYGGYWNVGSIYEWNGMKWLVKRAKQVVYFEIYYAYAIAKEDLDKCDAIFLTNEDCGNIYTSKEKFLKYAQLPDFKKQDFSSVREQQLCLNIDYWKEADTRFPWYEEYDD